MENMESPENIIRLKNVLFGYHYHSPVIDGVTLNIPKGGFIGLLGPSGSGKSTLLKLIVGLHKPWEGEILFAKHNNDKDRKFSIIGYSPQVEGIDWDFPVTVRELISMGVWNRSGLFPWINKTSRIEIGNLADELGIGGYAGLDSANKDNFLKILTDLNSRGITIILTTHDIDGVAKKLPWIVCLNKTIISQGIPNSTLSENILYRTYDLK